MLSFSHSRSLSFFVFVLFLPIVTSYSNLACCGYTCTYLREIWLALQSFFSPYITNASPLSRVTRRLVERSSNDIVTLHWIAVIVIAVVDSGRNLFFKNFFLASGIARGMPWIYWKNCWKELERISRSREFDRIVHSRVFIHERVIRAVFRQRDGGSVKGQRRGRICFSGGGT